MHFIGIGIGVLVGAIIGSATGARTRPVLKGAVKAGLRVSDRAQEFGRYLKEETARLTIEARAELNQEARE